MTERRLFVGIQAKRVQGFSPKELRAAVEKYATSNPPLILGKFIVAVSCIDDHREIANELYRLDRAHSGFVIEFWDQRDICDLLRNRPDIVAQFFSSEAVASFCLSGPPMVRVNTLPPAREMFVGCVEQLSTVRKLSPQAVYCLITGTPAVGKTELALQSVRRSVENARSMDALFVDLHGYSTRQRVDPVHALSNLLVQLGVPEAETPADPAAAVTRYQTELEQRAQAGRRVVLVLDNAGSYEQIHNLLPASPTHRVVVTSRNFMYDWVGVRRVVLSGLDEDDGITPIENVVRQPCLPTRGSPFNAVQRRRSFDCAAVCRWRWSSWQEPSSDIPIGQRAMLRIPWPIRGLG
jgi:hypothetical protein